MNGGFEAAGTAAVGPKRDITATPKQSFRMQVGQNAA